MTAPDLDTEQGRADYRRELRRVGWRLRWAGLGAIVVAALWVLMARNGQALASQTVIGAYGLLAVGWALMITAVFMRTRHHRRRMAQAEGARR